MLTSNEAMEIWFEFSDFDFMDCDLDENNCFTFFGVAKDGSTKIEKIHVDTLELFKREQVAILQ